jgi:inosine/xanthosine triphosphatase
VGVAVASGVPDQPFGDDETRRGAVARARAALVQVTTDAVGTAAPTASLGVGIEGGVVVEADGTMRTCAWAAVVDARGVVGVGGSLAVPLPPSVARRILDGEELSDAMDHVARASDTRYGRGAVGILTAGLIDRQAAYEPLVTYALAPWLAAPLFPRARSAGD